MATGSMFQLIPGHIVMPDLLAQLLENDLKDPKFDAR
jgi:hypothetical protein